MIQDIMSAGLAPFQVQVGWQGFAYGLLGLKTMRKVFSWVRQGWEDQKRDAKGVGED